MNIQALAAAAAVSNMGHEVEQLTLTALINSKMNLDNCLTSLIHSFCEDQTMYDVFMDEANNWLEHILNHCQTEEKQLALLKMIK